METQFKKKGWVYFPVTIAGWIVTILYCSISIYTLVAVDRNYNSLANSLIRFFPYFISYTVIFFWIACNTSKEKRRKK
jgi:uncharacterized membrane protein